MKAKTFLAVLILFLGFFLISTGAVIAAGNCTDTDVSSDHPDGKDYFTKGTVTDSSPQAIAQFGHAMTFTDLCYQDTGKVFEYYCDPNLGYSQGVWYTCPNGCSNGACIRSASCTPSWQTGQWSDCVNGNQTRTVTDSNNCGDNTSQPPTSQACLANPVTCTSFTYSDWSSCSASGTQTRTVTSSSPAGCTGGNSVTTQNCAIAPSITVTSPNGGENWVKGSTNNITWTSTGISKVYISRYLYDSAGKLTYKALLTPNGVNASTGMYSWTNSAIGKSKIYISSTKTNNANTISAISNDYFNITSNGNSKLTIISPRVGAMWTRGQSYHITWTSSGLVGGVTINLSDRPEGGNIGTITQSYVPVSAGLFDYSLNPPTAQLPSSNPPQTNYFLQMFAKDGFGKLVYAEPVAINIVDYPSCVTNWTCTNWSECINGQKNRACVDSNNCGTADKPNETQSCISGCTPDWSCGAWGLCSAGIRKRTCGDSNVCGTLVGKPSESQVCPCLHSGGETFYSSGYVYDQHATTDNDTCSWIAGNIAPGTTVCPYLGLGKKYCSPSGQAEQVCFQCPNGCDNGKCKGSSCTPQFNCGDWTVCVDGQQTRFCKSTNSCSPDKTEVQSCGAEKCAPVWTCSTWSSCSSGQQAMRTCIDLNSCGTTSGKPDETFNCPSTCVATNGSNIYAKGTASSTTDYPQTDYCYGNQYNGAVQKFYCDQNGGVQTILFDCPNGCVDGACNSAYVAGTTANSFDNVKILDNVKIQRLKFTTPVDYSSVRIFWQYHGDADKKLTIMLINYDTDRYYVIGENIPVSAGNYLWDRSKIFDHSQPQDSDVSTYVWIGEYKPPIRAGNWKEIEPFAYSLPYASNLDLYKTQRWNGRQFDQTIGYIGGNCPWASPGYYDFYGGLCVNPTVETPYNENPRSPIDSQCEYVYHFGGISTKRREIVNRYLKVSAGLTDVNARSIDIRWRSSNVDKINIVLLEPVASRSGNATDYTFTLIAKNVDASLGFYHWDIPDTTPSGRYLIFIGEYTPPYSSVQWGRESTENKNGTVYKNYFGLMSDARTGAYAESEAFFISQRSSAVGIRQDMLNYFTAALANIAEKIKELLQHR